MKKRYFLHSVVSFAEESLACNQILIRLTSSAERGRTVCSYSQSEYIAVKSSSVLKVASVLGEGVNGCGWG